jgi:hypothetical protein
MMPTAQLVLQQRTSKPHCMAVKVNEVRADSFFRLLLPLKVMADYFGVNNRVCRDKSRKQ